MNKNQKQKKKLTAEEQAAATAKRLATFQRNKAEVKVADVFKAEMLMGKRDAKTKSKKEQINILITSQSAEPKSGGKSINAL
jgi:hypothetical protein